MDPALRSVNMRTRRETHQDGYVTTLANIETYRVFMCSLGEAWR